MVKNKKIKGILNMILPFTTLFHFLAVIPPLATTHPFRYAYSAVVATTTILSAVWHLKGQPEGVYQYLDYSFITIWFFYDMGFMARLPDMDKAKIITISFFILCLHLVCSAEQNYEVYHSLWHIASSIKCVYVSYMLFIVAP
jgi:hypothetical protein